MFGGLDLKGAGQKKEEEDAKPDAAEAPAPASSAFSFLNSMSAPAPAAEAPAPASSAFSFMSSPAPEPAAPAASASEPAPAASSAFSFMSSPAPAPPVAKKEESEPEEKPTPAAATASSSFSFMQSTAAKSEEAEPAAKPSGFAFMASSDPPKEDEPATSAPASDLLSQTAPQPAGAGVTFGRAAAPRVIKKKRAPRARVGVAAHGSSAISSMSSSTGLGGTEPPPLPAPAAAATTTVEPPKPEPPSIPAVRSADEDDIIKAAKAAAKEAQHIEQQHHQQPARSFGLGGLFRPRGSGNAAVASVTSSASSISETKSSERTPEISAAERLRKEQEEAKRAMAERELERMQQQQRDAEPEPPKVPTYEPIPVPKAPSTDDKTTKPPALKVPSYEPAATVAVPPSYEPAKQPVFNLMLAKPKVVETPRPIPKTPTDKFHNMMAEFSDRVARSMEEVTQLRQQHIELLEQRFVTATKERLAAQQKQQAEGQQMAAAEAEDFELADRLGTVIQSHQQELLEHAALVENIGRAIQQLDSQKQSVIEGVSDCFQEIQMKLKAFQKDEESKEVADTAGTLKKFSAISKQISAEHDRLEQDVKHIERDEKLVEEERVELEASISEQSTEFESLRDGAKAKLLTVEDEIEELRRQLQAKQKVAAELRTEVAGHDESVFKVRVKFQRQLDRVKKKKSTIQDNREEWEQEKEQNEKLKTEHEAKVKEHSEALLARNKLLEALCKEIEMADTFESIVAKEMGFGQDEEEETNDELVQLQAEVVKSEASLTESKEVLDSAASALKNLENEIVSLEARIPQLEEMKKAAASKRDFKGAGKASKEAKDATHRLEECKVEIEGDAKERKLAAEEQVKQKETILDEKRSLARAKEKKSGVVSMRRLANNIKRLVATKESVCAGAEPHSIKGVASFVIDGQIEALMMEGQAYNEKYGGWAELVADCGVEGEETAEKEAEVDTEPVCTSNDPAPAIDGSEGDAMPEKEKTSGQTPAPEEDADTKVTKFEQFRDVSRRLQEVEGKLEAAVAEEDYELAAELDEALQELLAEVQSLNLTDEEMELALVPTAASSTADVEGNTPAGEANEETVETEAPSDTNSKDEIAVEAEVDAPIKTDSKDEIDGESEADAPLETDLKDGIEAEVDAPIEADSKDEIDGEVENDASPGDDLATDEGDEADASLCKESNDANEKLDADEPDVTKGPDEEPKESTSATNGGPVAETVSDDESL